MTIRYVCSLTAAAVLTCAPLFAQSNEQTPAPSSTESQRTTETQQSQPSTEPQSGEHHPATQSETTTTRTQTTQATAANADGTPIMLVGCLQRESDYRRQHDAGRGGVATTGVGLDNEFVLINATRANAAGAAAGGAADCASATAGAGEAYELTGENERTLAAHVGQRVQITGMLKDADTAPTAVGTSGSAGSRPTGGFDPLSQDLQLREVNVTAVSSVQGAAQETAQAPAQEPRPVGTAGAQQQEEPARIEQERPETLPRTASPLALAGLVGLLSLAGAFGIRALRRE